MADNNGNSKGNGASKRMSNPANAAQRARSWANGQRRKAARIMDQEQRERDNKNATRDELNRLRFEGVNVNKRPSKLVRALRRSDERSARLRGDAA